MRLSSLLCTSLLCLSSIAFADNWKAPMYEISITNLTKGVQFTPILTATHNHKFKLFDLGKPASQGLATIAEAGAMDALIDEIMAADFQAVTEGTSGLLAPGATATVRIDGSRGGLLSMAAMLLPTNDTFVGLRGVSLPRQGSVTYYARAYDAGSETNDELCINIPGPRCNGAALSPDDNGEGYVYFSPGVHGEGELSRSTYGWSEPVAQVVVTRVR
jgi:hypothetical protein